MSISKYSKNIEKKFALTNFSLRNRTTVLLLSFMITIMGMVLYQELPKDSYPEIKINQIYIGTPYPGNSPLDIENLVTRPIEKELNTISEVEEITSATVQDYSTIVVEFPPDMDSQEALLKVKDAVDKAKSELPSDLDTDPNVFEFDFASLPILNANLYGDFDVSTLNKFAEQLEEKLERVPEIAKIDIRGIDEKEVQILLDPYKMDAVRVTFSDIENAVRAENLNMSGGNILDGGLRRSMRILGEFKDPQLLREIVVKHEKGNIVHLGEIADILFDYREEKKSYARLNGLPVVSVDVVKRSGQNLLLATDKIFRILEDVKKTFPKELHISISNDQSSYTRDMVKNLENSIISGVILVVIVLLFFLGTRNALFVGIAIPLSMLLSFCVLGAMDATINMMVLFSLIMALGMLVDNGIVVTENIYRLLEEGKSVLEATKQGVGEVALPIISSTLTTLSAFFPLLLWPGIIGEFMKYLPITLIITLSSSLFVALVINPVLISLLMKLENLQATAKERKISRIWRPLLLMGLGSLVCFLLGIGVPIFKILGNLLLISLFVYLIHIYVLLPTASFFRTYLLPKMEHFYKYVLVSALRGRNPYAYFGATVVLLLLSFTLMGVLTPPVVFFPVNQPRLANIFVEFPTGTDIEQTNAFSKKVEKEVMDLLRPSSHMVESVITKVGAGAGDPNVLSGNQNESPNKALITVNFKEFKYRKGLRTSDVLEDIRERLQGFPGVHIAVEKDRAGPPVGKPISLELIGDDLPTLIRIAERIQLSIQQTGVQGIEDLKVDPQRNNPELVIKVDKEKARRYGLSTASIASEIRTSLFGKEISKYKEGEEDYKVYLRLRHKYRQDLQTLLDKNIVFRDQSSGKLVQVPISSVAKATYSNTYNQVNRKDLKRIITLSSNVLGGYNPTEVNNQMRSVLENFDMPTGYTFRFGGEQEKQAEEMAFLSRAFLLAVFMIFLIIVAQFNSFTTPFIIMTTVLFSSIGVLIGLVVFQMDFVVIMTMLGLISLAGVVVNNAIVLLDFVEQRRRQKCVEKEVKRLSFSEVVEAIVEAGQTRLRPVLLTAITTVLGLIPLAIGLNIDYIGFFSTYDPDIYIGGDNAIFWGPMSWAIIFGLTFATFLTLVIVPVMYWFFVHMQYRWRRWT